MVICYGRNRRQLRKYFLKLQYFVYYCMVIFVTKEAVYFTGLTRVNDMLKNSGDWTPLSVPTLQHWTHPHALGSRTFFAFRVPLDKCVWGQATRRQSTPLAALSSPVSFSVSLNRETFGAHSRGFLWTGGSGGYCWWIVTSWRTDLFVSLFYSFTLQKHSA